MSTKEGSKKKSKSTKLVDQKTPSVKEQDLNTSNTNTNMDEQKKKRTVPKRNTEYPNKETENIKGVFNVKVIKTSMKVWLNPTFDPNYKPTEEQKALSKAAREKARAERDQFKKENEARVKRGEIPLSKPKSKPKEGEVKLIKVQNAQYAMALISEQLVVSVINSTLPVITPDDKSAGLYMITHPILLNVIKTEYKNIFNRALLEYNRFTSYSGQFGDINKTTLSKLISRHGNLTGTNLVECDNNAYNLLNYLVNTTCIELLHNANLMRQYSNKQIMDYKAMQYAFTLFCRDEESNLFKSIKMKLEEYESLTEKKEKKDKSSVSGDETVDRTEKLVKSTPTKVTNVKPSTPKVVKSTPPKVTQTKTAKEDSETEAESGAESEVEAGSESGSESEASESSTNSYAD